MQAETLTRICPLCRRTAVDASPATRLCNECRAMLDPILPRAGLVQPDYAVALAGPATLRQADGHTSFAHNADFDADFDDVSFAPVARADEDFAPLNEEAADTFIAPNQYEEPEVFIAPDQYEDNVEPPAHAAEPAPVAAPARIEPAAAVAQAAISEAPIREAPISEATINESAPTDHLHLNDAPAAPSADPWDDPLPAWEYSHNEWPLLVKDDKPVRAARSKWPLVALAVVIVVAVAAAYLFFIKPRREAPITQQALTVPLEQPPANMQPPAAAPTTPVNPTPAAATETKEAPPVKEASPAPASQAADGQWKHALQAMASPNEAEANAFAERLKSAAIPAYVVRVEIAGHVWYRVRVGRFATAEEATRYAAEARNRARAAGVAIKDLQVTPYDKP